MTRTFRALVPTLVWAACAPAAQAKIMPSFHLDSCAWQATHVVVVDAGEQIDGRAVVLEAWKGDLRPGERVVVADLAEFADPKARAVSVLWGAARPGLPRHVSGSRVVLFLRRQPGRDDPSKGAWVPAVPGGIRVSTAWVEKGRAFAAVQMRNPGPQEMIPLDLTEAEAREGVLGLAKTQAGLARAAALADAGARADALRPLVASEVYEARQGAFAALTGCGPAALPALRRLLADEALTRRHGDVVRVMAKAGGAAAAADLAALLERDVAFWKKTGPNLPAGWWNGGNQGQAGAVPWEEVERLRERYGVTLEAVRGLREAPSAGGCKAAADLRAFWRTLPQLEDRSGLNQMSEACDEVLARTQP